MELSKKGKNAIVEVRKGAMVILAAIRLPANSMTGLFAIPAMKVAVPDNVNFLRKEQSAEPALANAILRKSALVLMLLVQRTRLLQMAKAVAIASNVPVANAHLVICSARR